MAKAHINDTGLRTRVLPVDTADLGQFKDPKTMETWELPANAERLIPLQEAATCLRSSSIPVGFPTETVYGLGADATRSDAVKGIYKAKGRPSDNPLIIHICDLTMLRNIMLFSPQADRHAELVDPIPAIYKSLIKRFWPGPMTILLPNPNPSILAPEVTAGLPTFGVRMPDSALALSLIHLAGVPLAAPSANASTKPSPTTAAHVKYDLDGRIELILDGGPCLVGVESTVVDGLCDPPVVLRPGGLSIDMIRECEGWSGVVKGYKDYSEIGSLAPRAPGMKYKHYSPKAKVILYEDAVGRQAENDAEAGVPLEMRRLIEAKEEQKEYMGLDTTSPVSVGIVSTKRWRDWAGLDDTKWVQDSQEMSFSVVVKGNLSTDNSFDIAHGQILKAATGESSVGEKKHIANVINVRLGTDTKDIAHGLFSALRELDQRGVEVIYVEGIEDEGDIAAAIMNRLRKAASVIVEK